MSDLTSKILPLAIAAAINPAGILVVVALLATAKRTALFLSAGFCVVFIAFGAVVLALGLRLELKPSTTSAVIDLVAAAVIVLLGVRACARRSRRTTTTRRRSTASSARPAASPPAWRSPPATSPRSSPTW